MISLLREVLDRETSTDVAHSQEILDNLISTLESLAKSKDLPQNVVAKVTLGAIPRIQWIREQLPEIDRLGWGTNKSLLLRRKIREVEQEFRRDLEQTRLSLVGGVDVQHLRQLIEKAQKLSVDASFSYIKLGNSSK